MDITNKDRIAAGEELIKDLRYDAETGLLWWTRKRANSTDLSKPAGSDNGHGYLHIGITDDNGKYWNFKAHILVWRICKGEWPTQAIDHIDRNRSNNHIENIRLVTVSENAKNQGVYKSNKLGYKNISMIGTGYKVQVYLHGKHITQKYFPTLSDAIAHRDAIRLQYGFSPATDRVAFAAE